jgi:streptogramin lyase
MKYRKTIFLLILLFMFSCTTPLHHDGGETTNGLILGVLVMEDGSRAANARVMLIDEQYDPVKDGAIADSLIDTTDKDGQYFINAPTKVLFNIEAVHLATGTRALIQKIKMEESEDTLHVPIDTMKAPGSMRIILSEIAKKTSGYLYIIGTTYFLDLKNLNDTVTVDSLPAGIIPKVIFKETDKDSLIASNVYITSSGISEVESGISKTLFTKVCNDESFKFVRSCEIDKKGNVWVGTDSGGLFVFDGKNTWKRFDFPGNTVQCHKIDNNGLHWIGSDNGLYMFDGTTFHSALIISEDTIRSPVKSIFVDAENKKWVATSSRIFSGDHGAWQSRDYGITMFTDIIVDKSGTIWIGTASGIIADYGTSQKTYSVTNSTLPSHIINFLVQDSAGGIWAGLMGGLVRIRGSNIHSFTKANNTINFTDISRGVIDRSGDLWFCGDGSNLCNFQDNRVFSTSLLWGKYLTIESISIGLPGVIWVGSYGGGLVRIEVLTQEVL